MYQLNLTYTPIYCQSLFQSLPLKACKNSQLTRYQPKTATQSFKTPNGVLNKVLNYGGSCVSAPSLILREVTEKMFDHNCNLHAVSRCPKPRHCGQKQNCRFILKSMVIHSLIHTKK